MKPKDHARERARLCYVDPHQLKPGDKDQEWRYAFFATIEPDRVWGDDWNDAPYEHNAGLPYPARGCSKRCSYRYDLFSVEFKCPKLVEPQDYHSGGNSPYSVQDINEGRVPWLTSEDGTVEIPAGATIATFRLIVGALPGGEIGAVEEMK